MLEVFTEYEKHFGAQRRELVRNYRSAPELVRMQHVIAQAVEAATPAATSAKADASGTCVVLEFSTPEDEADYLAELIEQGVRAGGMSPREFCIIVRQQTSEMIRQAIASGPRHTGHKATRRVTTGRT